MTDSPTPTPSADARESDAQLLEMCADIVDVARDLNSGETTGTPTFELSDDEAAANVYVVIKAYLAAHDRSAVAPASPDPAAGAPSLMSAEELDGLKTKAEKCNRDGWSANVDPQTVLRLVAQARLALGQAENVELGTITWPLVFWYRNHRGELAERRAHPIGVRWGSTEWHPEPQWLLRAFDVDKQAEREFAMADIGAAPPRASEADVEHAELVRLFPGVDTQIIAAAQEKAWDAKQPEWLWYEHEQAKTGLGRWAKINGAAPYIRADIAVRAAMPDRDPAGRVRGLTEAAEIAQGYADRLATPGSLDVEGAQIVADAIEERVVALRAAASFGREDGWLPIDTAPKDGTGVIIFGTSEWSGDFGPCEGRCYGNGWITHNNSYPSHMVFGWRQFPIRPQEPRS